MPDLVVSSEEELASKQDNDNSFPCSEETAVKEEYIEHEPEKEHLSCIYESEQVQSMAPSKVGYPEEKNDLSSDTPTPLDPHFQSKSSEQENLSIPKKGYRQTNPFMIVRIPIMKPDSLLSESAKPIKNTQDTY